MISTSAEYKLEQKQALREKSYMYINIGIINLEAKSKAKAVNGVTAFSNSDSAFRSKIKDGVEIAQYATLEDSFTKVDSTNALLPRQSDVYNKQQGLISSSLCGAIRIEFSGYTDVDIKGLTIDFGEFYPTSFTIANNSNSFTYTKDNPDLFVCENQFDDSSYLTITPHGMLGGNQRMRIRSLEFGVGLSFENEQIMSTQRRNSTSHISDTLPLKAFDFTIVNLSRRFSQDNPWSFASYIQQGQKVEYHYGREIIDSNDNSSVYIIPGGYTYIKTWSSDDLSAKFSCVGRLDMLDSEYYKGTLGNDTRTAYQLAENIFNDLGLSSSEYFIDEYLKLIKMRNPLPITTHKACLQMIANATKSVLREDSEGRICINSSFIPDGSEVTYNWEYGANVSYITYETINSLLDKDELIRNYVTLELGLESRNGEIVETGFSRVDDTMYIPPRNWNTSSQQFIKGVGYISECSSSSYLSINLNAAITFYKIILHFSHKPDYFIIRSFYENVVRDTLYFYDVDDIHVIEHEFREIDRIVITFCQTNYTSLLVDENDNYFVDENGNYLLGDNDIVKRVHLNKIEFSNIPDYVMTYSDMMNPPVATSIEHIKGLDINYYTYNYGTEVKMLTSVAVVKGENIIKLPNPASGYTIMWDDSDIKDWSSSSTYSSGSKVRYQGKVYTASTSVPAGTVPTNTSYWTYNAFSGGSITASGAYYINANITVTPTMKLAVYGKQMLVSYDTYYRGLHDTGNVKKLNNVLIQAKNTSAYGTARECNAEDVADYLEEYFMNDTEFTISYRGEPALECDDMIYLENQFVRDCVCRIEQEEIGTSIGMNLNNSIKLRRISYEKGREAIVGYAQTERDVIAAD